MKKLAILSPLVLMATTTLAQDSTCILQPSCSQLGYTSAEADCGNQKVLRCPFDVSQVACIGGSGTSGGSGGGDDTGDDNNTSPSCNIGDIYYADNTCSSNFDIQKDAIGIVFDTTHKLIVSLSTGKNKKWSTSTSLSSDVNITGVNINDTALVRDFNGKTYTNQLIASSSTYPAAEYCGSLTLGNKSWFLPSGGQMYLLGQQYNKVNSAINKINFGSVDVLEYYEYADGTHVNYYYWTSNMGLNTSRAIAYNFDQDIGGYWSYQYIYTVGEDVEQDGVNYETVMWIRCIAEY